MKNKQSISVAIADDHTMFRRGLAVILKNYQGIEVIFDASNGSELLHKIKQAVKKPDVCIVDINMPVMNGYDTVKELKSCFPNIRALALSMYDDERNIIQMIRCGANGYILKDSEPAVLVNAIKTVHREGFCDFGAITSDIKHSLDNAERITGGTAISVSDRELQFIKYACTEMTYKEIAEAMDVAGRTVDGYRDKLFIKLGVKSRVGLVIYALRKGIIDIY